MAMNERDAKFFRPLWIRVGLTAALAVWFVLETVFSHDQLWMGITAIGVIYCVWNFFLSWKDAPVAPASTETAAVTPPAPPEPPKQP